MLSAEHGSWRTVGTLWAHSGYSRSVVYECRDRDTAVDYKIQRGWGVGREQSVPRRGDKKWGGRAGREESMIPFS